MAERCLALTGQPLADKQLPKTGDLDHRSKKLGSCFSGSGDGFCVDMCVFIHVFLHTCRPTPCSVDVLQWIMFISLRTAEPALAGVAEIHSPVPPLCSARSQGCKADMDKDKKAAITEKWSGKTT